MNNQEIPQYIQNIKSRSTLRYYMGLIVRYKQWVKYEWARYIARKNGAIIGKEVILPLSLAKKANKNLIIGDYSSIQTDRIDLRSQVVIGSQVIIGIGSEIITTSHNIDSPEWEVKFYGIQIDSYVWIPTNVLILPSCRKIGYGAVVSSGSVVVKNVGDMSVIGGNPACEFKKRKMVHKNLVVEALLGGDYKRYKKIR